jgi:PAS domain S-box-containing protein
MDDLRVRAETVSRPAFFCWPRPRGARFALRRCNRFPPECRVQTEPTPLPTVLPAGQPAAVNGVDAGEAWSQRLRLLLESTDEGIFGIDLDGLCTFINRAGAQMLGWRTEQVLGKNMHGLMHHTHGDGSTYPEADCPIFNAFRQGLPCRIDSEVLWRADGSSFSAEYSSYPILDKGVVQGAVATFVDITERKHGEELPRQACDELEQRVQARTAELSAALEQLRDLSAYSETVREDERTRIARDIHDELGSLLVALKMDVNWLEKRVEDRPALEDKCQGMGRLIVSAVDKLRRIITDLRPSILDHQGLWAALEWQAQDFVEGTELRHDVQVHVSAGVLPPAACSASAGRSRCSASFRRCSATWRGTRRRARSRFVFTSMARRSRCCTSKCATTVPAPSAKPSRTRTATA